MRFFAFSDNSDSLGAAVAASVAINAVVTANSAKDCPLLLLINLSRIIFILFTIDNIISIIVPNNFITTL